MVVAMSRQSHLLDKPLNDRVTPSVDASPGVSVARLSCRSVGCLLDRKNRPIDDEQILGVSSDYPG